MAVVGVDVFEVGVFEDAIYADFTSTVVDRLDILNKIIFIKKDVVSFHPVDELYPEVRSIRRIDESVRVMDNPVSSQGNELAGANFTPRRAVLNNGWRIGIEFATNWVLSILGEMISDDGFAGAQLVKLDFMPDGISALVNYTPPSSEVIVISTGSGLSIEENTQLMGLPSASDTSVAVWAEAVRTLSVNTGLTVEESTKLLGLPSAEDTATSVLDSIA